MYSYYIYQSVHVSGDYVPIIRRSISVHAKLGTCYSVWMTVWYSGWNEYAGWNEIFSFHPAYQTVIHAE
jgi:hypothetical protein